MGEWIDTYDGVFFITISTLLFGCLGLCIKYCLRSKCDNINLCFGLITVHRDVKTEEELRKMRKQIQADRVFWISPGKERKPIPQNAIEVIAKEYGDIILARPMSHMSGDGVHPTMTGYKILAGETK